MRPTRARIERFIENMEAQRAPGRDWQRFAKLLSAQHGGAEAAMAVHLRAHPEDQEWADWLGWLWDPGQRPTSDKTARSIAPAAVAVAAVATAPAPVAVVATAPAPEPAKLERPPEPKQPKRDSGRGTWNPFTDSVE